jgi:hypothetical protein
MREDEFCSFMSDIPKNNHRLFAYRATIRGAPCVCYPLKAVATGRKGTSLNRPLRAGNAAEKLGTLSIRELFCFERLDRVTPTGRRTSYLWMTPDKELDFKADERPIESRIGNVL